MDVMVRSYKYLFWIFVSFDFLLTIVNLDFLKLFLLQKVIVLRFNNSWTITIYNTFSSFNCILHKVTFYGCTSTIRSFHILNIHNNIQILCSIFVGTLYIIAFGFRACFRNKSIENCFIKLILKKYYRLFSIFQKNITPILSIQ